jgi:hypothetical protein
MPTAQVITILGVFCSLFMATLAIASVIWYAGVKHSALEVKVNALWEYHLEVAQAVALRHGAANANSPVCATPEAKAWLIHRAKGLRAIFRPLQGKIGDAELFGIIFRECGRELIRDPFIPKEAYPEERIFLAMEVAKDLAASDPKFVEEQQGA